MAVELMSFDRIAVQEAGAAGLRSLDHLLHQLSTHNSSQFDCREIADLTVSNFKKMISVLNRTGHARFRRSPVSNLPPPALPPPPPSPPALPPPQPPQTLTLDFTKPNSIPCPLPSRSSISPPISPTKSGEFKILQVADMHYADGRTTACLDVLPNQLPSCSDLNTTAFIYRVIRAENPDLVVFTGDNIYGFDSSDAVKSMNLAFAPAVALKLPWAAILGNHDQEGTLSREGVMQHIVGMPHTLSRLNPIGTEIDGFGNYNIKVGGAETSALVNKTVLNLYFLDSGDYSTVPSIPGYGWIKPSQQVWFQKTSRLLKEKYMNKPEAQKEPAPGLVYFHIPLPEYDYFDSSNFTGVKQEAISSASINSGFFTTMVEAGDVKAVFTGHDHLNDFCGKLTGIQLCYAGGFGYHAYGKAGWSRRARVVSAYLGKTIDGKWGGVKSIKTWKRLDDENLSTIDTQILWSKGPTGRRRKSNAVGN